MKFMIFVAVILIAYYIISKRNKFNTMRRAVQQQGSSIGVRIAHRAQSLNDALSIAKINYGHEVAGIERLTAKDQLSQLAFLGEKYPQLQTHTDYSYAMQQAFELNAQITADRDLLNGNIRVYNDAISAFPAVLVAKLFGYKEEKFIDEENYEENKKIEKTKVDFSQFQVMQ